ncbi:MAG: SH3 domain-containing protein [Devosia sp.]
MKTIAILIISGGAAVLTSLGGASIALAQVVEGEEHCIVNVASWDRLMVRSEPSASGEIVTKHRYGDCGIIVTSEPQAGWVRIEDGHYEGWVNSKYLSMVSPSLYCVSGVDEDDFLNLRAYPSVASRLVAALDPAQCDIAFLPYAVGAWQKVRVEGYVGWASRKYLSAQ